MFEIFDHTADLGLRIRAPSRRELFIEAGRALFSLLVANLDQVRCTETRNLAIEGREDDYLLFDWLSELLYLFDAQHLVFSEFDVELEPAGIQAAVHGEPVDLARHKLEHDVKAITYHGLKVERTWEGWQAEVIVDI